MNSPPLATRIPANKGRRYPAAPPRVEEIVAVMRRAGDGPYGLRMRGLFVVLWRPGLRVAEALALAATDLEPTQGAIVVRRGKGGRRRIVRMDDWGWSIFGPGWRLGASFLWARSSASSAAREPVGRGRAPRFEPGFASWQSNRGYADALPLTSFATRMPLRWRERACR